MDQPCASQAVRMASSAAKFANEKKAATPGPGEYDLVDAKRFGGNGKPSASFASAVEQRGQSGMPNYDTPSYVPEGIGAGKRSGASNMGFGGADRGLGIEKGGMSPDSAEVMELRSLGIGA